MKIWIDAQLPPTLANWLSATFELEAVALRDLPLRDAKDIAIFESNYMLVLKKGDRIINDSPVQDKCV